MREGNWTGKGSRSGTWTCVSEVQAHHMSKHSPTRLQLRPHSILLSRFHIPVCLFQCGSITKHIQIRTSDLLALHCIIKYAQCPCTAVGLVGWHLSCIKVWSLDHRGWPMNDLGLVCDLQCSSLYWTLNDRIGQHSDLHHFLCRIMTNCTKPSFQSDVTSLNTYNNEYTSYNVTKMMR